jgi:hypothetical protein
MYETIHADVAADFEEFGASVEFVTDGRTYNPATDTFGGVYHQPVAGTAISVKGDREQYRDLGLVEAKALTLLFRPATFGEKPPLGSCVTWAGVEYNVNDVLPLAPAGETLIARVIVSR